MCSYLSQDHARGRGWVRAEYVRMWPLHGDQWSNTATQLHTDTEHMNEHLHLMQEGIYYKWASVKMTLKFHFLWSTLF